jgi:hypothetical protein
MGRFGYRRTTSGSILVARRAGKYRAASDTQPNISVTPANVAGSDALTAYTKLANALLSPNTLHQASKAAAEFQKILDHRGVVTNEPIGALAHLGLARAYVLQGDTAKARAAYIDFLTLWKDADPEIPILRAAKSEYAKLR